MLVDLDAYRARTTRPTSARLPGDALISTIMASPRRSRFSPENSTTHEDLKAALAFVRFLPGLWEIEEGRGYPGGGNPPYGFLLLEPAARRGTLPWFRLNRLGSAVGVMIHIGNDAVGEWENLERATSISAALAVVRRWVVQWYGIDRVQGTQAHFDILP